MPIVKSGSHPRAAGGFWNVLLLCHPPAITVFHVMLVQHNCHAEAKIPNCAPLGDNHDRKQSDGNIDWELTPGPGGDAPEKALGPSEGGVGASEREACARSIRSVARGPCTEARYMCNWPYLSMFA
jgi:hypothetical protein